MHIKFYSGNKEEDQLRDVKVNDRMILKLIIKKEGRKV
jgi:hypothetical protein